MLKENGKMALKMRTIEALRTIMERDYQAPMSDGQLEQLGVSLLRLSRLALVGLARAEKRKLQENN